MKCRQDFGDYEGSLIDHLHNMALMYAYDSEYYDSVASSNTPELAEKNPYQWTVSFK